MSTFDQQIDRLEVMLEKYDADFKCNVASLSMWSGVLRLTLTNQDPYPSRSITFFAVAGNDPEDVMARVLDDAEQWLAESGIEPLPPPDWMGRDANATQIDH